MKWNLFLDDERYPIGSDWIIARNSAHAKWCIRSYGLPQSIYFDHDLNEKETGYDFAKWFCETIMDGYVPLPNDFQYYVHSQNPIGAENIRNYMDNFLKHYNETY